MIENYQTRILGPDEIIDYRGELMRVLRPEHLSHEPLVGFKVLCRDMNAHVMGTWAKRFQMIDTALMQTGFLKSTGCVLRETQPIESNDGYWLITFPVPVSMMIRQLNQMMNVLAYLSTQFGIVSTDVCEINVSGHCTPEETESRLTQIIIPNQYAGALIAPNNTPYKVGHIVRINNYYVLLRTMWDFSKNGSSGKVSNRFNELTLIPQLLANAFH